MPGIRYHAVAVAMLCAGVCVPAWAGAERALGRTECPTRIGDTVRITEVLTGDSIRLEDGRVVRLSGIDAPRPSQAGTAGDGDGLAATARGRLATLVGGVVLHLVKSQAEPDRHGRIHG